MGRREKPITTTSPALRELAEWLREQRDRSELTYRDMAARAGAHPTTLTRAASGETIPPLDTVLAYARACGAPDEQARTRWRRARYEQYKAVHGCTVAPKPDLIVSQHELSMALHALWEKAGAPAPGLMARRAGAHGQLPRSTAHRILRKLTVPGSDEQLRAFLVGCEVPAEGHGPWEAAYFRASRSEQEEESATPAAHATRLTAEHHAWLQRIHPKPLPILQALDASDPRSTAEVARRAGMAPSTAGVRLREMRTLNLVTVTRRGRAKLYLLTRLGERSRSQLLHPAMHPTRRQPNPEAWEPSTAVALPPPGAGRAATLREALYQHFHAYCTAQQRYPSATEFAAYLKELPRPVTDKEFHPSELQQLLPEWRDRHHQYGGLPPAPAGTREDAAQPDSFSRAEFDRAGEAVNWALEHLQAQFDVETLASRAQMSRRSFERHFRELTGKAPLQWIITQRVLAAQRMLETTDFSVDEIAVRGGFRSPVALRGHFRRQLGVSPAAYRVAHRNRPAA